MSLGAFKNKSKSSLICFTSCSLHILDFSHSFKRNILSFANSSGNSQNPGPDFMRAQSSAESMVLVFVMAVVQPPYPPTCKLKQAFGSGFSSVEQPIRTLKIPKSFSFIKKVVCGFILCFLAGIFGKVFSLVKGFKIFFHFGGHG